MLIIILVDVKLDLYQCADDFCLLLQHEEENKKNENKEKQLTVTVNTDFYNIDGWFEAMN